MTRTVAAISVVALLLVGCSEREDAPDEASQDVAEPVSDREDDQSAEDASDEAGDDGGVDIDREDHEDEGEEDRRPRSHLTGQPIDEALLDRPLLAAKIENHPQARPQTGLDLADVVYEELVEGGLTRFVAVFHSELPEAAGPIRSARPVTVQLMWGYGPSAFAYSGARDEVQRMLRDAPSVRITEGGEGFYRDEVRNAPHDLYIEPAVTLRAAIERGAEPVGDLRWVFDQEPPPGGLGCPDGDTDCTDPGAGVDVRMSHEYVSTWDYDAEAQRYRRGQEGEPFETEGDGEIGAANVVVLETDHYIGGTGYPETDLTTEDGAALILRDGRRYEARWSKPAPDDVLELRTTDGAPFPLKPGATWVHLPDTLPGIED